MLWYPPLYPTLTARPGRACVAPLACRRTPPATGTRLGSGSPRRVGSRAAGPRRTVGASSCSRPSMPPRRCGSAPVAGPRWRPTSWHPAHAAVCIPLRARSAVHERGRSTIGGRTAGVVGSCFSRLSRSATSRRECQLRTTNSPVPTSKTSSAYSTGSSYSSGIPRSPPCCRRCGSSSRTSDTLIARHCHFGKK
jgi:hypothetical protein